MFVCVDAFIHNKNKWVSIHVVFAIFVTNECEKHFKCSKDFFWNSITPLSFQDALWCFRASYVFMIIAKLPSIHKCQIQWTAINVGTCCFITTFVWGTKVAFFSTLGTFWIIWAFVEFVTICFLLTIGFIATLIMLQVTKVGGGRTVVSPGAGRV